MYPLQHAHSRLLQLANKAGAPTRDLPPNFHLRIDSPSFVTGNDAETAARLLAEECTLRQKGKPLIRTKKKILEYEFKCATAALTKLVQDNGSAGVAQALLERGGQIDIIKDDAARIQQEGLRNSLLKVAVQGQCMDLVSLFASSATPEQLVDPMITALLLRDPVLIRLLFEYGANADDFHEFFRSAIATSDIFMLELFMRAPKGISASLAAESATYLAAASRLDGLAVLVQHPAISTLRTNLLEQAMQSSRFDLFMTVLFHTRTMPNDSLTGLMRLTIENFKMYGFLNSDFLEALVHVSSVALRHEAEAVLVSCAQFGLKSVVRLLVDNNIAVRVTAVRHAVQSADTELLAILLSSKYNMSENACQSIIVLPQSYHEAIRHKLLEMLLNAGANGEYLDDELINAVSQQDLELARGLLKHGASPDRKHGRALIRAMETAHVEMVKVLLKSQVTVNTLQLAFPVLRRIDQLPRRILTKLLLAEGATGEVVDVALRDAVCDITEDRDEELIKVLLKANASCGWNDAEALRATVAHGDAGVLYHLLNAPNTPQVDVISSLVTDAMDLSNEKSRNKILENLILAGALGEPLNRAFCTIMSSNNSNLELLQVFISKGSIDLEHNNGEPVLIATASANDTLLEIVFQLKNVSVESMSLAVYSILGPHSAGDNRQKASRLRLIFRSHEAPGLASDALFRYIENRTNGEAIVEDEDIDIIKSLIEAGADGGACLPNLVTSGWITALKDVLSGRVSSGIIAECLSMAVLLPDSEKRRSICEILVGAGAGEEAVSQALIESVRQSDADTVAVLLRAGADINYAGGSSLTVSVADGHEDLVNQLLKRNWANSTTLEAAWSALAPLTAWSTLKASLAQTLLHSGLIGSMVDSTLVESVRIRNFELCSLILTYRTAESPVCSMEECDEEDAPSPTARTTVHQPETKNGVDQVAVRLKKCLSIPHKSRPYMKPMPKVRQSKSLTLRKHDTVARAQVLRRPLSFTFSDSRHALEEALLIAVTTNQIDFCRLLIKHKASVTYQDFLILQQSILQGDLPIIQLLIGAVPAIARQSALDSGLRLAVTIRAQETCTFFIRMGANVSKDCLLELTVTGQAQLLDVTLRASTIEDIASFCLANLIRTDSTDVSKLDTFRVLLDHGAHGLVVNELLVKSLEDPKPQDHKLELAKLLVEYGADLDHDGGQSLCYACRIGDVELIQQMLTSSLSAESRRRAFAYLFESSSADEELVESIESFAIKPEGVPAITDETDFGPLWEQYFTQRPKSPDVLSVLLKTCGRDRTSSSEQSILSWTLARTQSPIDSASLRVLITYLRNINDGEAESGSSPILLAVNYDRHDIIADLVKHGASLDKTTLLGESALLLASRKGSDETVRRLIRAGARPNDGSLHEAARELQVDIIHSLLRHGHDVNHLSDFHGDRTVLGELCLRAGPGLVLEDCQRLRDVIDLLLNEDAETVIETEGKSPIFQALDNLNPVPAISAILRAFEVKEIDFSEVVYQSDEGLCYSPTRYFTDGLALSFGTDHDIVLEILRQHNIKDRFYAIEGPQPDGAVGLPLTIEERRIREQRLSRDCEVCGERPENPHQVFGPLTETCTHEWSVTICRECLDQYLEGKTQPHDGHISANIQCWAPDCRETLSHFELQTVASPELFARYDTALMRQVVHAGQSFMECAYDGCEGSGWYEPDEMQFAACECCHRLSCIACNVPWHIDSLCPQSEEARRIQEEEEQNERDRERRVQEEQASVAAVQQLSKNCPNSACNAPIQKNDGCDHMTCSRCRYEFCWLCLAPYARIRGHGNREHYAGCNYYA